MEHARRNPSRKRAAPGHMKHYEAQQTVLQPRQRAARKLRRLSISEFNEAAVRGLNHLQRAASGPQNAERETFVDSCCSSPSRRHVGPKWSVFNCLESIEGLTLSDKASQGATCSCRAQVQAKGGQSSPVAESDDGDATERVA